MARRDLHLTARRDLAPALHTGKEPCKFVALHANTAVQREERGVEQIEFEDEDDSMRKLYEDECAKNGVRVDM